MARYLSIDTEATGLEEDCVLIQLAFVPVDTSKKKVYTELGVEYLVQCASWESLKPNLNEWVIAHNEQLIKNAHAHGLPSSDVGRKVREYLKSDGIRAIFGTDRPVLLGKSLSALDLPLLARTFGGNWMRENFHHHTLDVTCVARGLVDAGVLPEGCQSTSKLVKHLGVREDARHTALSDAVDMADVYLRMLGLLSKPLPSKPTGAA